jgi:hypothetical protein
MAEIIHLRQARKRKKRADKEAQAAENRARHGRTKAETGLQAKENAKTEMTLDGKKLDPDTR